MNPLKRKLDSGAVCINGWLLFPAPISAEIMARAGWDSLTVDMQHGIQDYRSAVHCFQALHGYPVTPVVRVPWNEPGIIGKVLDAGAWGVICPMVNSAEQAKALVDACLYPPLGSRSNGPIRAVAYGEGGTYQTIANDEVLVIPMIETKDGVANVREILDVPGVSGIYVGPGDLGLAHGLVPKLDRDEPQILDIYKMLVGEAKRRGKFAGVQNATVSYAARMAELGFRLLTVGSDGGMLEAAAKEAVRSFRASAGGL
jgi:4-hydroxy-2-oxoheptanedioate aldolase